MRDFRTFVLTHVAPLALAPQREHKIVDEWAAQLEEIYDALRADGLSDDEAWSDIEQQVRSGTLLNDRLLDDALEVSWLSGTPDRTAPPDRIAVARGRLRMVRRKLRETLATGVWRDVRGGGRMLFKNPGFSATVVLTLAICLGANAAIFTVVHDVLLRPLPFADPDRIVGMGDIYPRSPRTTSCRTIRRRTSTGSRR